MFDPRKIISVFKSSQKQVKFKFKTPASTKYQAHVILPLL